MAKREAGRLSAVGLVLNCINLILGSGPAVCDAQSVGSGQAASKHVRAEQMWQVSSGIDQLVSVLTDEYAAEPPKGRQIQFMAVSGYGTIAIATFILEGFAHGNNVHQFLAIFGPPNEPGETSQPRFALSALTEVGDECAVDARRVQISGPRSDGSLRLTLPMHVASTIGSCGGKTHRSFVLSATPNHLGRLEPR